MTQKEIIENNILIALFMGWKINNSFPDKDRVYQLGNKIEIDTTFNFHSDWNSLYDVIEKIENKYTYSNYIGFIENLHIQINKTSSSISFPNTYEGYDYKNDCYNEYLVNICEKGETKIEAVYKVIVKLIKEYINTKII